MATTEQTVKNFRREYKTPNYDPAPIRRCVRVKGEAAGVTVFVTKSFRDESNDDKYNAVIEENGDCRCTCNDFKYKFASQRPKVWMPWAMCKHLSRAAANMERKGTLPQKPASRFTQEDIDSIIDD